MNSLAGTIFISAKIDYLKPAQLYYAMCVASAGLLDVLFGSNCFLLFTGAAFCQRATQMVITEVTTLQRNVFVSY